MISESLSLVKASERLGALVDPIRCVSSMTDSVSEAMPDLKPETDAIQARLMEALDHVKAAMAVLNAKADLL